MDYKKLLEKAKSAYDKCATGAEKRMLESIFPELKEDEDERIREALINMFKGYHIDKVGDFTDKEIIAWLEKQGEQKPVEWSEKYIADVFEQVGLAKIVREQSNDNLTNALQDAMIELSKFIPQPKPAWSEEDEEWDDDHIDMFYDIQNMIKCCESIPYGGGILRPSEKYKIQLLDWLKSLRPQKKH